MYGGVPRPRPVCLLRLLRNRACADVLPHRAVGSRRAGLCRHEVLRLHDVRFGVDAGRHLVARVSHRGGDGQCRHVRPRRVGQHPGPGHDHRSLDLPVVRPRLCGEGATLPGAHLASRCPHQRADRRFGDLGRGDAQAGDLRVPPFRDLPLPRGRRLVRADPRDPGHHRDHLRRHRGHDATRPQTAGRLLLGGAPRFHHHRFVLPQHRRDSRAGCSRWSTTASPPAPCSSSSG